MGAVAPQERSLAWEGCHNVRDLGGLQTASGELTRHRAVVRADNMRGLTLAGWAAALRYGVRRIVDLRFAGEVPGERPAHSDVDVVEVSLYGEPNHAVADAFRERMRAADDVAAVFAAGYVEALEANASRVGEAVAAVVGAHEGSCVVVHCFAGKDRTGLVTALMLSAVGVADETVADDYAVSGPGVELLSADWFATAADAEELALRRKYSISPRETMIDVLGWVRARGGAEAFLADAGLSSQELVALRRRLIG